MADYPEVSPKSLIGRATQVRDLLRAGVTTDDDNISLRLLMRVVESTYARVLQDDLDERVALGQPINPQLGFDYHCECLEDFEDCEGVDFMVKKVKIPQLAQFNGNPAIFFFGADGVSFVRVNSKREAKAAIKPKAFQETKPAFIVRNNEAVVYLPALYSEICFIDWSGIPQSPSQEQGDCFDIWSEEYPILEYLWEKVVDRILNRDGNTLLKTEVFKDTINDSRGNVQVN